MRRLLLLAGAVVALAVPVASAEGATVRYCGTSASAGYLGIVAVGPTSCSFARATMISWWRHGRPSRVRVFSRATGRWYTMRCRVESFRGPDANPHGVCRGGHGARAELRS